jgi:chemotaxis protein CheD
VLTPPRDRPIFTPPSGVPSVEPAYVPPGRLLATRDPKPIATVVSTGAVVCLWDPVVGIGGMAHFLLPESGTAPPAPRFGDVALRTLVDELVKLGASERRLRACLYGGSAPPIVTEGGHLGDRNVQAARTWLGTRSITVWQAEVGGTNARKVLFTPNTGAVVAKAISPNG